MTEVKTETLVTQIKRKAHSDIGKEKNAQYEGIDKDEK